LGDKGIEAGHGGVIGVKFHVKGFYLFGIVVKEDGALINLLS
jgi:hypothetical protein